MSLEKATYKQFEPIITQVTITDTTGRNQTYGPAGRAGGIFRFELTGPDGNELRAHNMPESEIAGPSSDITYDPFESRSGSFNLLLTWPAWRELGSYTLSAYGRDPTISGYHDILLDSLSFDIARDASVDSTAAELLAQLSYTAFHVGGQSPGWYDTIESPLDSLADLPGMPPYVREFAEYVNVIWTQIYYDLWGGDSTEVTQRIASFQSQFPQSVYMTALQLFDLVWYGGETPWEDQLDTQTSLLCRVFLEGPYESGRIDRTLAEDGLVPSEQPYTASPWNYDGKESGFGSSVYASDWVLVRLLADSPPDSVVASAAGVILWSGHVLSSFRNLPPGQYRVVIDHRNHVAIQSDTLVNVVGRIEYDFTTGHALGANAQKEVEPGVFAMWAGDANADGEVTTADSMAWAADFGQTGYLPSDFNLDGQVSGEDLVLWLQNSFALAGPFDLDALLDRIATYLSLAEDQDWITDSVLVNDLGGVLQDASLALTSGDSTWAASLLGSALAQVEEENGATITTEGYELLNGSIEDALSHLPPILEVKVLLEGAYPPATGQMATGTNDPTHDDIPLTQPFGVPNEGPWDFTGTESLTVVPRYAIDWVLVFVFTDSSVVSVSPGLLDRDGNLVVSQTVVPADSFRIAVQHRNHVVVASDTLVNFAQT
ncbi:MAG: hypothetical protein WBW88_01405, partial [Rhodothermales bacterium]